jgi:SAM-dependent methyltransferase
MPVLQPSEYDISYFLSLNVPGGPTGEFWSDLASRFSGSNAITNKQVLEIGCAKGFFVKDLRDLGVDAYGLEVSQYAIDNCEPGMDAYLTVGDARTYLSNYVRNQWDFVVSLRFLECIDPSDMPSLVSEMNRISKKQVHIIDTSANALYYEVHDLTWWDQFSFANGTRLVDNQNWSNIINT